jgi:hypothetical protein
MQSRSDAAAAYCDRAQFLGDPDFTSVAATVARTMVVYAERAFARTISMGSRDARK